MKERRQLTAIKSTQRELLTDPHEVGQELAKFLGRIMSPNGASKAERDCYLVGRLGEWSTMGRLW